MIVATSGHIDHGKTSLVKALTGVDTDRLPEEKQRGLSIDIGFAYPKNSSALGFVDVPGHERFVRNMIAGVTAIDCALLVIAADDGPMPQTREHLAILDLLGIKHGVVALTKIDSVAPDRIEEARLEIADLLAGSFLADAPVFALSSVSGEGIDALRHWLETQAGKAQARNRSGFFRMAIDRAFIIEGAGLVATGAVSSGEVKIDDRLMLAPEGVEVRVRGIHAQNRKAQQGRAGERCAINIAAPRIGVENVHRGQWLIAPEMFAPTDRFNACITLLGDARPMRHWSSVHLHVGAAAIPARVALLEGAPLAPGENAMAQIVLQQPISALYGDRFVLRDHQGQRTIGGGYVIDPFAPARGRAKPERLSLLRTLDNEDHGAAAHMALLASPAGLRFGDFVLSRNLAAAAALALRKALGDARFAGEARECIALSAARWNELKQALAHAVQSAPSQGISKTALAQTLRPRISPAVLDALLAELVSSTDIVHAGGHYRARGASIDLDLRDAALWTRLKPLLDNLRPPSLAEMATELKADQRSIERLLQKIARMGLAVQIAPNRYYDPRHLQALAEHALAVASETPGNLVSIRAFRDASGVGRNLSVEALEFFDRLGFTARAGEHRRVMKPIDQIRWTRAAQP